MNHFIPVGLCLAFLTSPSPIAFAEQPPKLPTNEEIPILRVEFKRGDAIDYAGGDMVEARHVTKILSVHKDQNGKRWVTRTSDIRGQQHLIGQDPVSMASEEPIMGSLATVIKSNLSFGSGIYKDDSQDKTPFFIATEPTNFQNQARRWVQTIILGDPKDGLQSQSPRLLIDSNPQVPIRLIENRCGSPVDLTLTLFNRHGRNLFWYGPDRHNINHTSSNAADTSQLAFCTQNELDINLFLSSVDVGDLRDANGAKLTAEAFLRKMADLAGRKNIKELDLGTRALQASRKIKDPAYIHGKEGFQGLAGELLAERRGNPLKLEDLEYFQKNQGAFYALLELIERHVHTQSTQIAKLASDGELNLQGPIGEKSRGVLADQGGRVDSTKTLSNHEQKP